MSLFSAQCLCSEACGHPELTSSLGQVRAAKGSDGGRGGGGGGLGWREAGTAALEPSTASGSGAEAAVLLGCWSWSPRRDWEAALGGLAGLQRGSFAPAAPLEASCLFAARGHCRRRVSRSGWTSILTAEPAQPGDEESDPHYRAVLAVCPRQGHLTSLCLHFSMQNTIAHWWYLPCTGGRRCCWDTGLVLRTVPAPSRSHVPVCQQPRFSS